MSTTPDTNTKKKQRGKQFFNTMKQSAKRANLSKKEAQKVIAEAIQAVRSKKK